MRDAEPAIYLDYNATAPVRPEAAAAVAAALAEPGNPSSVHGYGRAARGRLEESRAKVAALVGAAPSDVVFTSGGSEANALALLGAGRARILVSAIEHDSVLATVSALGEDGAERLPVDGNGVVRLEALEAALARDPRPTLVSIMRANNETGVLQPVAEAAMLAHAHGALIHTDAIQAAGKMALDLMELGVDYLSLSAHKIGGPQGVGALVLRAGASLAAQHLGGGQERGRRAGTENGPGIAGFGAAAQVAAKGLADFAHLAALRDRLESELVAHGAVVYGNAVPRLANTSAIAMPGVASETQIMAFDLAGIAVSAGAACSSGKVRPSHVLRAAGASEAEAACAIRVSLGWTTKDSDVERLIEAWDALRARTRSRAA
ncbi:MAG TPA: cysteine desulfurase family protein [Alphaproteobacteria bacterium]|nr:cysteine desulfurase family protein [Alphaproteobacteria bacterium]